MDLATAIENVLRRLDAIASGLRQTPYDQAFPISVGRKSTIDRDFRGEQEILRVPSFPMQGRTWAVNVQSVDPPVANGAATWTAIPQYTYQFLRLHWTLGQATEWTVDLDMTGGGVSFAVMADSIRVCFVSEMATPTPTDARAVNVIASVGLAGPRPTALPRRTVIIGEIKTGAGLTSSIIPRGATQVTVSARTTATQVIQPITIQFLDFAGNLLGSGYSPATSMPGPIDIPNGASLITVANTGPADAIGSAVYRIAL